MTIDIKFKRGTAAQNNNFTGAPGEISIDTDQGTIRVHDGSTKGGNIVVSDNYAAATYVVSGGNPGHAWHANTTTNVPVADVINEPNNKSVVAANNVGTTDSATFKISPTSTTTSIKIPYFSTTSDGLIASYGFKTVTLTCAASAN